MAIAYPKSVPRIIPYKLQSRDYIAIGRIVQVCASLEELLTTWLSMLSTVDEGGLAILLGLMPISGKEQLAEKYAKICGPEYENKHRDAFQSKAYKDVMRCRNVVAHGIPIGITDAGQISFKTTKQAGVKITKVVLEVVMFTTKEITFLASLIQDGAHPGARRLSAGACG